MKITKDLLLVVLLAFSTTTPAADSSKSNPSAGVVSEPKTVDDLFDRYVKAMGGREALEKIKSSLTKGTIEVPAFSSTSNIEIWKKAPNQYFSTVVLDMGSIERVFDGQTGWSKDPFGGGVRELTGLELRDLKQDAEFYLPLKMRERFPEAKLTGKQKMNTAEFYVVEIPVEGKTQKIYFDAGTGLLTRWDKENTTPEGPVAAELRWEDYREVDGVKVPFVSKLIMPQFEFTIKLAEVKHNLDIPATKFHKPAN